MAIKLLTTKQAAEMLQLSASTLEDWRWKRIGPRFIRVSGGCIWNENHGNGSRQGLAGFQEPSSFRPGVSRLSNPK